MLLIMTVAMAFGGLAMLYGARTPRQMLTLNLVCFAVAILLAVDLLARNYRSFVRERMRLYRAAMAEVERLRRLKALRPETPDSEKAAGEGKPPKAHAAGG